MEVGSLEGREGGLSRGGEVVAKRSCLRHNYVDGWRPLPHYRLHLDISGEIPD